MKCNMTRLFAAGLAASVLIAAPAYSQTGGTGGTGVTQTNDKAAVKQLVEVNVNTAETKESLDKVFNVLVRLGVFLNEIRTLSKDIRTFSEGIDKTSKLALTGKKSFPVNNSGADIDARKAPDSLYKYTRDIIGNAYPGSPAMADAAKQLSVLYKLPAAFKDAASIDLGISANANVSAQALASAALADNAFVSANASMGRLDGYIKALESSNDLKTSIDINTRVVIEQTQQTNEALRTQAATAAALAHYLMAIGGNQADTDDPTENMPDPDH